MKEETRLKNIILQIQDILHKYPVSAVQMRYINAQVRKNMNLVIPKTPKRLPVYLTPGEIYHFLETADKINPKYRLFCEFMITTGLRVNESRNIILGDFRDNNQLLVRHGKGNKERFVPYTNTLFNKIKLYMNNKNGYLWTNSNNKTVTNRTLQNWVYSVGKSSNLTKKVHIHSLRHTFACLMLSKGLRLEELKTLMGHSSIKTTEIYGRLELGSIKEKYLSFMGDI